MTIHRYAHKAYKHQLKKDFEENKYLPKTVDGLLDYLFSEDQWGDKYSNYIVYRDRDSYDKTTLKQRINLLWVFPMWFVFSPFLWLFTGKFRISQHSKLGKWLAKITGL